MTTVITMLIGGIRRHNKTRRDKRMGGGLREEKNNSRSNIEKEGKV